MLPRIALLLLWICAIPTGVRSQAGPVVALGSAVADENGRATIEVAYLPGLQPVAALQFDLTTPDGSIAVTTAVAGPAGTDTDKTIYVSDAARVLIAGPNASALGAGVVVRLSVQVAPRTAPGLHSIVIANVVGASPDGDTVTISGATGVVLVRPPLRQAR